MARSFIKEASLQAQVSAALVRKPKAFYGADGSRIIDINPG
jgi:hypothetical protein